MGYLQGIDISSHQGTVDHAKVAASGMKFCICKATEGRNFIDPRFAENIAAIRAVGGDYFPGAYHFARPSSDGGGALDGAAEANDFCDVIQKVCGDIREGFAPPALDFEEYSQDDEIKNIPWIRAWIEVVVRRTGRIPMIYAGRYVWRYEVGNTSEFTNFPLWQVDYSEDAVQPASMPWPGWTLWQYSGGGKTQQHPEVPGAGVVDVNRFCGDIVAFRAFCNGQAACPVLVPDPPGPPEPVDIALFWGIVSPITARVQTLLLAHGYGPDGLIGSDGFPDGLIGPKTESALSQFKVARRLGGNTLVDDDTWAYLAYDNL